jgi:hypothetical protein
VVPNCGTVLKRGLKRILRLILRSMYDRNPVIVTIVDIQEHRTVAEILVFGSHPNIAEVVHVHVTPRSGIKLDCLF